MSTAPNHSPVPEETAATVSAFWFGDAPAQAATDPTRAKLWWSKQPDVDAQMAVRFGKLVDQAGAGQLDGWAAQPAGLLALILLTDQFPRNIHRGTPQAFAFDATARAWTHEGLRRGAFDTLLPIQRVFAYLPLEHSESLDDQDRCVELMARLQDDAPSPQRSAFVSFADYAVKHRDIILRFGRFPHRNAILGRASTPEEEAFLKTPGSSF